MKTSSSLLTASGAMMVFLAAVSTYFLISPTPAEGSTLQLSESEVGVTVDDDKWTKISHHHQNNNNKARLSSSITAETTTTTATSKDDGHQHVADERSLLGQDGHGHGDCGTPEPRLEDILATSKMASKWRNHPDAGRRSLQMNQIHVYFNIINDGTDGNVSDATIAVQVDVLNNATNTHGFTFDHDPNEIERVTNASWFENAGVFNSPEERAMKQALHRGTKSDLNVYLTNFYNIPNFLGHATFPYFHAGKFDGVIFDYKTVPGGSIGRRDEGEMLVHEVGHWLHVFHTFENGCDYPGDGVDDTPYQATSNFGCDFTRDTCPQQPGTDPIQNFMDFSNDDCRDEFSLGQGDVMRASWPVYRAPTCSGKIFQVNLVTDQNPAQTDWYVREANGENLCFGIGSYRWLPETSYTFTCCIEELPCTFTIFDSGNDGLTDGGNGNYNVTYDGVTYTSPSGGIFEAGETIEINPCCRLVLVGFGFCLDSVGSQFSTCRYTAANATAGSVLDACLADVNCIGYDTDTTNGEVYLRYSTGLPPDCPGSESSKEALSGQPCFMFVDNTAGIRCYEKRGDCQSKLQAGCGGDPHFLTWSGQHYNYHGECDLVFVSSKNFQGGKGIHVHVRTKIENVYSIITAVAIQVDKWVFEFNHETVGSPMYYIRGVEVPELPYEEGQFKVSTRDVHNEDYDKVVQFITVAVGTDATFHISIMDQWVHVTIDAASHQVKDSIGLSGSFPKGELLGRDGSDLSHDRDAFGSDWQVQPEEPQLFRTTPDGHPQAPVATCKLPEVDGHQYLRTRNTELYNMAVHACKQEGLSGLDLEDCIFDVAVMNNPKIAAAWWATAMEE